MEEPISLYLDLESGTTADLEIVARTTLAFADAVKEIAYIIDPSLEVSLKFASGTEGSLSLNTLVKSVQGRLGDKKTLAVIALTVLHWFGTDVRQYVVGQGLDKVFKGDQKLTPEDIQQITDTVSKAIESKIAERNVQRVYKELQRDPAVKGVGASQGPQEKPQRIIPRSEFSQHLPDDATGSVLERRTREEIVSVTLISPVLLPGNRRWRFSFHEGEFGAPIKDERFLSEVLNGHYPIVMRTGIQMDVLLETKEEKEGGVWVIKERNVLEVIKTSPAPTQENLDLPKAAIKPEDNSG